MTTAINKRQLRGEDSGVKTRSFTGVERLLGIFKSNALKCIHRHIYMYILQQKTSQTSFCFHLMERVCTRWGQIKGHSKLRQRNPLKEKSFKCHLNYNDKVVDFVCTTDNSKKEKLG